MKSILFISKAPPYRGGGAESVIWELGKYLAQQGWDVHYLCPDGDAPEKENIHFSPVSVPNSFFAEKAGFFLKSPLKFIHLLKTVDPDIVYDNSSPIPYVYAYLTGRTTLTKVHAVYGKRAFANKDNPITKIGTIVGEQMYRFLDGNNILAVSKSTQEELKPIVNRRPEMIHLVENGIKVQEFNYNYNLEGNILCLCAMTPRKNIGTLLKAWKRLQTNTSINRRLIIAGDGPRRAALERKAKNLNLENVQFLGYIDEKRKKRLMSEAFIYVLPTKMEGFGLSNLEAMASGCVTISSDTLGVKDYLVNGENGYLTDPMDYDKIAATIKHCIENPSEQEQISKAARQTAMSYELEDMLYKEKEVLESFL